MRLAIRNQFMWPLCFVAAASLAAVGVVNYRIATMHTKLRIEQQLRGVVAVLAQSSYPLTDSVLEQMGGLANAKFVLTDATGNRLASGSPVDVGGLPASEVAVATDDQIALGPRITLGPHAYFHSSVWIGRRTNLTGPSVLHVLFPQTEFNAAWRAAFFPPLLVGVGAVLAVGLVVHLVAGRLSGVLSRLGDDVRRLAAGDFSEVVLPKCDDETLDLAVAINHTAQTLADFESELKQTERARTVSMLGAGLAHELRNAATGCRLAVDLHAEECDRSDVDECLGVARRQLAMIESRLRQLLQMGRLSHAAEAQVVDFSELVSESVALLKPSLSHANVALRWDEPRHAIPVNANSEELSQAVMNLLLNALDAVTKRQANEQHAAAINVALRCREESVQLVVSDSGDGPDHAESEDLFQPFVTGKAEGIGLGLSVARRVVESFDGKIGWKRDAGHTLFTIELPLAGAEVGNV